MTNRQIVKRAAIAVLDCVGRQHPRGHQASKAARYVLTSADGTEIEVMFEKNEGAPPNLWCTASAAGNTLIAALNPKFSPRSKLWAKGAKTYGRHSALEDMDQLGDADLVCFAPESLEELGQIIDRLLIVTKAELI